MEIQSDAFKDKHEIPEEFTCHGKNMSPPLKWDNLPPHTVELALICEDPDAPQNPPFVHWVAYNIPKTKTGLEMGAGSKENSEISQGRNSAGEAYYLGPNPPPDTGIHRYYFRLFALDDRITLRAGASASELLDAIRDHVLAEAELCGRHEYH